ncbi:MAG: leucine-rich repeat protein [Clostridiales bacterium]|nr:leucine-rich repeat protein [Clostridiales bacterium]
MGIKFLKSVVAIMLSIAFMGSYSSPTYALTANAVSDNKALNPESSDEFITVEAVEPDSNAQNVETPSSSSSAEPTESFTEEAETALEAESDSTEKATSSDTPEITSEDHAEEEADEIDLEEADEIALDEADEIALDEPNLYEKSINALQTALALDATENVLTYTVNGTNAIITDCQLTATSAQVEAGFQTIINEGYTISAIGNGAFWGCEELVYISLPDTVTEIGNNAFNLCTSLENITLSANLEIVGEKFISGTKILSITIPKSVTSFSDLGAFKDASNLVHVTFEQGTINIPSYVLYQARSVKSISIPESVASIDDHAFNYCIALDNVELPDSIIEIKNLAFYGCESLKNIKLPAKVEKLGGNIIQGTSISSITIPKTVTTVNSYAFSGTDYLIQATFEDGIVKIPANALSNAKSLTSVTIPSSVKEIGNSAFDGCLSLENLILPPNVEKLGNSLIRGTKVSSITLPRSVTETTMSGGNGPLSGAEYLTKATFEDGIKAIPNYALYGAKSLTEVIIPNSVTIIGDNAFRGCIALKSISLPDTILEIGYSAFEGCESLESLTLPAKVEKLSSTIIRGTKVSSVIVPKTLTTFSSDGAFNGAELLTQVDFEDGTIKVPNYALSNATKVTSIILPDSVTEIGNYAFNGCQSLTNFTITDKIEKLGSAFLGGTGVSSITIPKTVTIMQSSTGAFYGANNLTNIVFADGTTRIPEYALNDASSITSVTIPDSVTVIGKYAFLDCTAIDNLTFSDAVTEIEEYAFSGCKNLKNISLPAKVIKLGNNILDDTGVTSITIPKTFVPVKNNSAFNGARNLKQAIFEAGTTEIPNYALFQAIELTSIVFPDTITRIGDYAFYACVSLKNLSLPDTIKEIGNNAFERCTALETIALPANVEKLGSTILRESKVASIIIPKTVTVMSGALIGAKNLTQVTFEHGTTRVPPYAFNSAAVTSVTLPDTVTVIGYGAFSGCIALNNIVLPNSIIEIGDDAFEECSSLDNLILPANVNKLGSAFISRTKVASITIPKSVTTMVPHAFYRAEYLTEVIFEEGTTKIPDYALSNATKVSSVIIPDGVLSIGEYAFQGCVALDNIYLPATIKEIGNQAFIGCANLDDFKLPAKVEKLGNLILKGTKVSTLTIPKTVTTFPNYSAFKDADYLAEVIFEDGTEKILSRSLFEVESVTTVVLPDSVTSIGNTAFYNCVSLVNINLPDSIIEIEASAFSGCTSLENISLPAKVEKLGSLFLSGTKVASITIPKTVISLSGVTFDGANYLANVTFEDGTTKILDNALYNAQFVTYVIIPESATAIGNSAFYNTKSLERLYIPPSVTSISSNAFLSASQNLVILGYIDSYAQIYAEKQKIDFLPLTDDKYVSLMFDDRTSNENFSLHGFAAPGKEIQVYDGATLIATFISNKSGRFSGSVKLTDPIDNSVHTIRAQITSDTGAVIVASKSIVYQLGAPRVTVFNMFHNSQKVNLLATDNRRKILIFRSGQIFTFEVKIENAEMIEKLFVNSERNGINSTLEAKYDQERNIFIASGLFNDDPNYVPGFITIRLFIKGESNFVEFGPSKDCYAFSIDPSGYIFEAVTSNRLIGVTTTAYWTELLQDGTYAAEALWDATEWDQYNPLTTDIEGRYAWDVPEGLWQVKAEKAGYTTVYSEWLPVPPPQTDVNIAMASTSAPEISRLNVYSSYAEVEFSQYMDPTTVTASSVLLKAKDGASIPFALSFPSTEKALDGTVYAKVFKLAYADSYKASGEGYSLAVTGAAKNYAGTPITPASRTAACAEPVSLTMPKSLALSYGQPATIDILAENYVTGLTIQAFCEFEEIAKVVGQPSFDANGKASLKIECILPGETNLVVMVPEAGILHIIPLSVSAVPEAGALTVAPGDGTEVMRGGTLAFSATSGGASVSAVWSVSGGAKAGTAIDASTGVLTIASDETAKELTVTADTDQVSTTVRIKVALSGNILYGDADGDGSLTRTDLARMRQYFAGWPVEINEAAADVVVNGVVDRADLARMRQYYAGWEVALGQ